LYDGMHNDGIRRGYWLAPLLAGAVLGPALQLQQPALWPAAVYAASALAGLALALSLVRMRTAGTDAAPGVLRLMGILLTVALVAFGACGLRALGHAADALDPAQEGRDLAVTGVVAAMPQQSELGLRFLLEVEAAHDGAVPARIPPRLLLSWYNGARPAADGRVELQRAAPDLRAGDRWRVTVRLKAPHGNANPHGFDYELWLWEQGVHATGYVRATRGDPTPERLSPGWRHPVERARQASRDAIYARLAPAASAGEPARRSAGLLAALGVGDQNAIDRADWDVFRATGTAHLMSISGLHITLFAWAAGLVVGAGWRRSRALCLRWPAQHAALAGGLLLAAGYALFSGWGVPAQRTVWMLATVALLRLSGRHWPWPMVWGLAAAVVVTFDPWALLQAGFWLSFVAVGVLFASGAPAPASNPVPASRGRRVMEGARSLLREQARITLALAPLTLLLFGQMSVVGLAANLLAIPWITFLVTPLALVGVALPLLWDVAAFALQALGAVLARLAVLPFATWSAAAPPLVVGAVAVLGGVLIALRLPPAWRFLGVPLLLPVLFWPGARPAPGAFELLAADIGQGNAVVVRTANHTLVYDAGPRFSAEGDAGHRVLVPLLRAIDARVDTLVVSHRDNDHSGGAAAVLAAHPGAGLLSSVEPGHTLQTLRQVRRCEAGQRWEWDGVAFEVLHPAAADYAATARPNALSCVLRVASPGGAALLAGDIEAAQEARLVTQGTLLAADVLLVPHHGSKTSSTAPFIEAVRPRWAVVQSGYRNRFGHPAGPVVQRLREAGARTVDSARCGAARWSSEQPEALACQREQDPRYWQHRLPVEVATPALPP
jgi:competence protein ComEC